MKYSKQKDEMLRLLHSGVLMHPNASEVFLAMKEILPNIGIATVYRNLNAFAEAGLLTRISTSGEADRFDERIDDHHHMICDRCGCVVNFERSPHEQELASALLKSHGFDTRTQSYIVRGVCKKCLESPEGTCAKKVVLPERDF